MVLHHVMGSLLSIPGVYLVSICHHKWTDTYTTHMDAAFYNGPVACVLSPRTEKQCMFYAFEGIETGSYVMHYITLLHRFSLIPDDVTTQYTADTLCIRGGADGDEFSLYDDTELYVDKQYEGLVCNIYCA